MCSYKACFFFQMRISIYKHLRKKTKHKYVEVFQCNVVSEKISMILIVDWNNLDDNVVTAKTGKSLETNERTISAPLPMS